MRYYFMDECHQTYFLQTRFWQTRQTWDGSVVFTYFQAICALQLKRTTSAVKKLFAWGKEYRFCEILTHSSNIIIEKGQRGRALSIVRWPSQFYSLWRRAGRCLHLSQCHWWTPARPHDSEKTRPLYWLFLVVFFWLCFPIQREGALFWVQCIL